MGLLLISVSNLEVGPPATSPDDRVSDRPPTTAPDGSSVITVQRAVRRGKRRRSENGDAEGEVDDEVEQGDVPDVKRRKGICEFLIIPPPFQGFP